MIASIHSCGTCCHPIHCAPGAAEAPEIPPLHMLPSPSLEGSLNYLPLCRSTACQVPSSTLPLMFPLLGLLSVAVVSLQFLFFAKFTLQVQHSGEVPLSVLLLGMGGDALVAFFMQYCTYISDAPPNYLATKPRCLSLLSLDLKPLVLSFWDSLSAFTTYVPSGTMLGHLRSQWPAT